MKMRADYARGHQWITCSASAATDQSFPVDIGTSKFFSDFSFMSKPIFITKAFYYDVISAPGKLREKKTCLLDLKMCWNKEIYAACFQKL